MQSVHSMFVMLNFRFDTGTVFHWPEARRTRTASATARVKKRDHKWQQLASRKPECRQRRLRCSRRKPCTSCHGYDCTFTRHCLSRFHSFYGLIVCGQVALKHQHSWYALMNSGWKSGHLQMLRVRVAQLICKCNVQSDRQKQTTQYYRPARVRDV